MCASKRRLYVLGRCSVPIAQFCINMTPLRLNLRVLGLILLKQNIGFKSFRILSNLKTIRLHHFLLLYC